MNTPQNSNLLRKALLGNALFSSVCGVTLCVAAPALQGPLGISALALRIVGVALLPFAFGLYRNGLRPSPNRREAWAAVALDLGWVLGSALLLATVLRSLPAAGTWTVIGVADVVLVFALLQTLGLRRSRQS